MNREPREMTDAECAEEARLQGYGPRHDEPGDGSSPSPVDLSTTPGARGADGPPKPDVSGSSPGPGANAYVPTGDPITWQEVPPPRIPVVDVGAHIVMVPVARTEPCTFCRRTYDIPRAEAVERVRSGKPVRLQCQCGATIVAQRKLVQVAKAMPKGGKLPVQVSR